MAKLLLRDMSVLKKWGPKNEFRATLPKFPACGLLHGPRAQPLAFSSAVGVVVVRQPGPLVPAGAVAYHWCWSGFATEASPTRFARHGPASTSFPQLRYPGVNGYP